MMTGLQELLLSRAPADQRIVNRGTTEQLPMAAKDAARTKNEPATSLPAQPWVG